MKKKKKSLGGNFRDKKSFGKVQAKFLAQSR